MSRWQGDCRIAAKSEEIKRVIDLEMIAGRPCADHGVLELVQQVRSGKDLKTLCSRFKLVYSSTEDLSF